MPVAHDFLFADSAESAFHLNVTAWLVQTALGPCRGFLEIENFTGQSLSLPF